MYSQKINGQQDLHIKKSDLTNGIYFVRLIQGGENTVCDKLLKY